MKTDIETLINGWIKENEAFIDDNYCSVEDWLLDCEDWDGWQYDFFTVDEVDWMTYDEMYDKVVQFVKSRHYDVTAEEYINYWM